MWISFYSVTLLWSTFSDTRFINGSVTGFKIKPTTKNPMPNNVNIINFVIKISGTIPPTVSRNESMAYVNGKYGEMFWKIVVSFELGMYPTTCNL